MVQTLYLFLQECCKFESNRTSDWLNSSIWFSQLEVVFPSNACVKNRKINAGIPYFLLFQNVFNPLLSDKFLDWSKLKAFADDKIIVTE